MQEFQNTRNPILPLEHHIPDCEGRVMPDGKLYVYGSYDEREDMYCSEKYHVVSTPDMKHWTIHGISLTGQQISWFNNPDAPKYPGIDWSHPTPFIQKMLERDREIGVDRKAEFENTAGRPQPPLLFAPDCVYKDGKYYLYFCMPDDSEGVAVSDRPEGPFNEPIQLPCGGIDPTVLIDDDGQAYLYWGQLFSHGVKLNPDMRSFDPADIVDNLVTEEAHFFHEGSSVRKIGDTYYYVYADMERGKPSSLGYSTSKSPLGPFTYRGIIIDSGNCDPASWNNHGSIECFNGQWYVFYHRCSRGVQQYRRLCVEKIEILPDGTIPEVKMTSQGVGDPFGPGEKIMGYHACEVYGGCFINVDEVYGEKLTNISDGGRAVFRYIKSDTPWTGICLTCAGSGTVKVLINGAEAGTVGVIGKAGEVQTVEAAIQAPAGEYELILSFEDPVGLEIMELTLTSCHGRLLPR